LSDLTGEVCRGCGDTLRTSDRVIVVYRELAHPIPPDDRPRETYVHPGHEPKGYRIIGRGVLLDLLRGQRTAVGGLVGQERLADARLE